MTGSPEGAARILRVAVATLVVIGLGHASHALGGGTGPQPLAVVVLAALVAPLVWALVRLRASAARLAVAMGLGQVLTHLALVAMAPEQGVAAAAHVHGAVALSSADAATGLTATLHLTPGMLAAHALATVLAAVLLSRGEDAVRAVVRALLPQPLSPGFAHGIRRLAVGAGALTTPTSRALRPLGGRGPPLPVT